ncbi:hypothetical protein UlMin_014531 [Ulmus minor]
MSSLISPPTLKPDADVTLSLTLPSTTPSSPLTTDPQLKALKSEERGIFLIQNLFTCAKHAASGNLHHADACLNQIAQLSSINGDSIQRLSARFASALAVRLVKRWPGLYKALNRSQTGPKPELNRATTPPFLPCFSFAYAIIARNLVHSMAHQDAIHIVDLGSGDSRLWVPLLRSFAIGPRGPPQLNFTCVHSDKAVLAKLGQKLVKEAEAIGMAFQYNPVNVGLRELNMEMMKVRSDEALALVSILSLHELLAEDDRVDAQFGGNKEKGIKNSKQMGQFLAMVRSMSPKVVLLVEQEADLNLNRLVDRFLGSLHYYSAVFDSLDFTLGASSDERLALEEVFGKEIENIVACEGLERVERHEKYEKWMVRFGQTGFRPVRMWFNAMDDAKKMVEGSGIEGYKIVNSKASLILCWHERPLYAVSAWI